MPGRGAEYRLRMRQHSLTDCDNQLGMERVYSISSSGCGNNRNRRGGCCGGYEKGQVSRLLAVAI